MVGLVFYVLDLRSRQQRLHLFRVVELPQAEGRLWAFNPTAIWLIAGVCYCTLASAGNTLRYQSLTATTETPLEPTARALQGAAQCIFYWTLWTVACALMNAAI